MSLSLSDILVVSFTKKCSLVCSVIRAVPMDGAIPPADVPAQQEQRRLKALAVVRRTPSPTRTIGIEDVLQKPPIPTWEMDRRTSVIPQAWDADTPQVVTEPVEHDPDVEIMVFEEDDTLVVSQAETSC
jgi:hypothetical protein